MSSRASRSGGRSDPDPARQIRVLLDSFRESWNCLLVLLVDRGGPVLSGAGSPGDVDPLSLASVASAHFSASAQLASRLGGGEFTTLLHRGGRRSVLLVDVGGVAVLTALFGEGLPSERTVREAGGVAAQLEEPTRGLVSGGKPGGGISMEWVTAAEREIDRIFRDEA